MRPKPRQEAIKRSSYRGFRHIFQFHPEKFIRVKYLWFLWKKILKLVGGRRRKKCRTMKFQMWVLWEILLGIVFKYWQILFVFSWLTEYFSTHQNISDSCCGKRRSTWDFVRPGCSSLPKSGHTRLPPAHLHLPRNANWPQGTRVLGWCERHELLGQMRFQRNIRLEIPLQAFLPPRLCPCWTVSGCCCLKELPSRCWAWNQTISLHRSRCLSLSDMLNAGHQLWSSQGNTQWIGCEGVSSHWTSSRWSGLLETYSFFKLIDQSLSKTFINKSCKW